MTDPSRLAVTLTVAELEQLVAAAVSRLLDDSASGGVPRVAGSPEEWGVAYGFSGPKVRELIRRGLPHFRVGAQTRILYRDAAVLAWLRDNGDYLRDEQE